MINMVKNQPANPQQAGAIAQLNQAKIQARQVKPINVVFGLVGVVMNALALLGGLQLRSLSGYGLAMTGTICAVVPLSSC